MHLYWPTASTGLATATCTVACQSNLQDFPSTAPRTSCPNFILITNNDNFVVVLQESCRFLEHATHAVQLLGKCLTSYGDPEKFDAAQQEFAASHCPYTLDSALARQKHSQVACLLHACVLNYVLLLHCTLSCSAVYYNWSCLWVCLCVCVWVGLLPR